MKNIFRNILLAAGLIFMLVLTACGPTPTQAPAEPASAKVTVQGEVNTELTLTTVDPAGLEIVKVAAEHPKNGPGEYEGVRLNAVLEKAGVKEGASTLLITASDGFSYEAPLADVQACADCLIGIEEGKFNMVMPGMSSKAWVKDVITIEVK